MELLHSLLTGQITQARFAHGLCGTHAARTAHTACMPRAQRTHIGAFALCFVAVLLALLCAAVSIAAAPRSAFADSPTYSMAVVAEDVPSSVAPGNSFTVALTLENNQSSEYTMYAMSATVRYDTSMLEVVSMDMNNNIDAFTRDAGDGWTDAVLNFKASSLSGVTWSNDTPLMYITFNALEQGTSSVLIQRANISNSTGMGRYACTCTDAVVTISNDTSGDVNPVAPSDNTSEGTTEGVDAPEADASATAGKDTSDTMTEEEKAEYEKTRGAAGATNGSSNSSSGSSNSSSSSNNGTGTSGDTAALGSSGNAPATGIQIPVTLAVLIGVLVVAVIALIVGILVHRRKKGAATAQLVDAQSHEATDNHHSDAHRANEAHELPGAHDPSKTPEVSDAPAARHSSQGAHARK